MNLHKRTKPEPGTFGLPVALANSAPTEGGVWNVLCYEVDLKGRDAVITKQHLEECVRNFAKYPKVPVVIEHADTDWWSELPDDYAEPHGWITALRLGEFTRSDGSVVTSLEGQMALDEETKALVNGDPPKWPFGSVTLFFDQRDLESGDHIGAVLWSFSLTAHPALVDVPQLVASVRRKQPQEPISMNKQLLTLAARMGINVPNDIDEPALLALLQERAGESAEVRKALSLGAEAPFAKVIESLTALSTRAAKAEADAVKLHAEQRANHVAALIAAQPEMAGAKDALVAFANADYAAFSAKYPKPSEPEAKPSALAGRHLESLSTIAESPKAPKTVDAKQAFESRVVERAQALLNAGIEGSFASAVATAEYELAQEGGA